MTFIPARTVSAWGELLDRVPVALVGVDVAQRVTFWNHAAEDLYGVSVRDALQRRMFSGEEELLRVDPQQRAEISARMWAGQDWAGTLDVVRPDGATVTVRVATAAIVDEQGAVVGGIVVAELLGPSLPAKFDAAVRNLEDAVARISGSSPPDASRTVGSGSPGDYRLTPRQREVVELLLEGLRVSMIAERLDVSTRTVHSHLGAIYNTLGVHSQRELLELGRVSDREPDP